MHPQIKIILAGLLIIAAAGVVTYDLYFMESGEDGEPVSYSADQDPAREEMNRGEDSVPAGDAPAPLVRYPHESVAELRKDEEPERWYTSPERAPCPLGREWENTLWHELLIAYAERRNAEPVEKTVIEEAPPPPTTPDPRVQERLQAASDAAAQAAFAGRVAGCRLQGILCGEAGASALIDGRIYRAGDFLPEGDPIRIGAIGKKYVVFHSEKLGATLVKRLVPLGSIYRPPEDQGEDGEEREASAPPAAPVEVPPPEEEAAKEDNSSNAGDRAD